MSARPGYKHGDRAKQIHAVLKERGPTDVYVVASAVNLSRETTLAHLKRMRSQNMVRVVRDGRGHVRTLYKAAYLV